MEKSKMRRLILGTVILAVLIVVPHMVFADSGKATTSDLVVGVGILGLMAGAATNTVRGWWTAPDEVKYSVKKLLGSILLAAVQAPIAIGYAGILASIGDASILFAFFTMFTQGFTVDVAHTATKN